MKEQRRRDQYNIHYGDTESRSHNQIKTFDAEEVRQQRIGERTNFNTKEPEKKKTEEL